MLATCENTATVADTLQSTERPPTSERRIHWRQRVLLSCVELGEDNGGIILNISQSGLALQAVEELVEDELPTIRFQLSQSHTWVEAKGRIAWRSPSNKTAGIKFVDLPEESRRQIRTWIDSFAPESVLEAVPRLAVVAPPPSNNQEVRTDSIDGGTNSRPLTFPDRPSHLTGSPLLVPFQEATSDPEFVDLQRKIGLRRMFGLFLVVVAALLGAVLAGYYLRGTTHGPEGVDATVRTSAPSPTSTNSISLKSASKSTVSSDGSGFALQVAAMTHRENAVTLAGALQQRHLPAFVFQAKDDRFFRVFVGPYGDEGSMTPVMQQLKSQGFESVRAKWPYSGK